MHKNEMQVHAINREASNLALDWSLQVAHRIPRVVGSLCKVQDSLPSVDVTFGDQSYAVLLDLWLSVVFLGYYEMW